MGDVDYYDSFNRLLDDIRKEIKHKEQNDIIERATQIMEETRTLAKLFPNGSDTKTFLDKLAAYLEMRSKNTSRDADYSQINSRAHFILGCLNAISDAKNAAVKIPFMGIDEVVNKNIELIKKEMTKLNNFLAEESIKPFKGCFSQKMYDMLTVYRSCLFNRKQAIQTTLGSVIPLQVGGIVSEYDENGDILNNEISETKSLNRN